MSAAGARTREVTVPGAELLVVQDGTAGAPALMLFSGAACTTALWEPCLPALTGRYHVIRHDVRGGGHSRATADARRDLDRLADDAEAILDALGIADCIAWGMAFGARVALALAARHPDRVRRLILNDASVEPPDPPLQRQSAIDAQQARAALGIAEIAQRPQWFEHDDRDSMRATLRAVYATDDHARYPPLVRAPTLIATGELDPNLAPSRRLAAMISDSRLEVIAATGHASVLQRPDVCLALVDGFLAEARDRA